MARLSTVSKLARKVRTDRRAEGAGMVCFPNGEEAAEPVSVSVASYPKCGGEKFLCNQTWKTLNLPTFEEYACPQESCKVCENRHLNIFIWLGLLTIYFLFMGTILRKETRTWQTLREETTLCLSCKHAEQHSDNHGSLTKRKSNRVTETDSGPLEYGLNLPALTPTWKYPKCPLSGNGQTVVLTQWNIPQWKEYRQQGRISNAWLHLYDIFANCKDRKRISGWFQKGTEEFWGMKQQFYYLYCRDSSICPCSQNIHVYQNS